MFIDHAKIFVSGGHGAEQRNTEQRWNDRQELLVQELTHRIKNTLSIVSALVQQTLRHSGDKKEAQSTLLDRIASLAKAHDLFLKTDGKSADVGDLARSQLAGLVDNPARIRLEGGATILNSELATPLGLMLHELATNAVKYGALSNDDGCVDLRWNVTVVSGVSQLRIVWTESRGPRVEPPQTHGFGTQLIEHAISSAVVSREFLPDGLICTIEFPLRA